MIFLDDPDVTIYCGDVLETLRTLPDESFHMACTSPPFYGLRDYGTGTWEGGDEGCDHRAPSRFDYAVSNKQLSNTGSEQHSTYRDACGKCGAHRVDQQIGLEATPDLWVARLVEVFREVRRVLRADGTLWVEIGDSYNSATTAGRNPTATAEHGRWENGELCERVNVPGMKPKDLLGQPWLLAFALRADGWYLRSEIIWSKPNPMPESVTDRPTVSHSRVFLLAKSARYFYDAEAIREPNVSPEQAEHNARYAKHYDLAVVAAGQNGSESIHSRGTANGRNRRSVWQIPTQPYPEAHFATWPQKLVEPMILAGTSDKGVCPECGAPWGRMQSRTFDGQTVEVPASARRSTVNGRPLTGDNRFDVGNRASWNSGGKGVSQRHTLGWQPTCECFQGPSGVPKHFPHDPEPATVLDPFGGSGTTAYVARRLGRRAVLIELNAEYCELARKRLLQPVPEGAERNGVLHVDQLRLEEAIDA